MLLLTRKKDSTTINLELFEREKQDDLKTIHQLQERVEQLIAANATNEANLNAANKAIELEKALIDDLPLFSAVAMSAPAPSAQSELEEVLTGVQPDSLSPKEALDLIYELKSKLKT